MRKVLAYIFCLLLIGTAAYAGMSTLFFRGTETSGGEDSCGAGALLLSWHMEDTDLANENGCSVLGDSTWSVNNAPELSSTDKSDGSTSAYSDYSGSGNESYQIDPTQNKPVTEGTIWFDFRPTNAHIDNHTWVYVRYDTGATYIMIRASMPGLDIELRHDGATTGGIYAVADTNINYTQNKWWRVKAEYKVGGSPYTLRVSVWELDNQQPRQTTGSPIVATTATAISTLTNIGYIELGQALDYGGIHYIDNFKYYATSDL